jgi:hypothetical protein
MLKKYLKRSRLFTILVLSIALVFSISSVRAQATVISVINATDGSDTVTLPANTPVGTTFLVNITIADVTNLAGWQINVTYDARLLNITGTADMILPDDHIFAGLDPTGAPPNFGTFENTSSVMWARAVGPSAPQDHFDGSGIMCQIQFTTVKNGTDEPTACNITLVTLADDPAAIFPTSIIDPNADDIPFTANNGFYTIPEFPVTTLLVVFLIITSIAIVLAKKNSIKRRKFLVAS